MEKQKLEQQITLEIEELEERIAPTPLTVNPNAANGNAPSNVFDGPQSGPFAPAEVDGTNADGGLIMAGSKAGGVIQPG